jgi:hypothetical protein
MNNKEIRKLATLARTQNWEVERTDGDHYRWIPPSGENPTISGGTPGSARAIVNLKNDLKSRGLVFDRNQYRRYQQEVEEMAEDTIGSLPSAKEVSVLIEMALTGKEDRVCEWCDKEYVSPVGAAMHRRVCKSKPDDNEENDVKRNLDEAPPLRDRLTCPLCPFFCWISQPHIMESHLAADHGRGECPHCHENYLITRGGLTKHIASCEKKLVIAPPQTMVEKLEAASIEVPMPDGRVSVIPTPNPEKFQDPNPTTEEIAMANLAAVPAIPETIPAPPIPAPAPAVRALPVMTADASDDDLWTHLEMVLDGPMLVNRETLAAINAWMEATRVLLALKAKQ